MSYIFSWGLLCASFIESNYTTWGLSSCYFSAAHHLPILPQVLNLRLRLLAFLTETDRCHTISIWIGTDFTKAWPLPWGSMLSSNQKILEVWGDFESHSTIFDSILSVQIVIVSLFLKVPVYTLQGHSVSMVPGIYLRIWVGGLSMGIVSKCTFLLHQDIKWVRKRWNRRMWTIRFWEFN